MSEPTGEPATVAELTEQVAVIAEEWANAKLLLLHLTERKVEVDELATATDRLAEGVGGVERVLRGVAEAQSDAKEAKAQAHSAKSTANRSLAQLAETEHRYRRHTRRIAAIALVISLAATGFIAYLQRDTSGLLAGFRRNVNDICQRRVVYDTANHNSIGADITYLQSQLAAEKRDAAATTVLIRSFPPSQRATLRAGVKQGRRDLETYLAKEKAAYAQGVIRSCQTP